MKILVALEPSAGDRPPVLQLLERLDLDDAHVTALGVVPPIAPDGWHLGPLLGDPDADRRERVAQARTERYLEKIAPAFSRQVTVGRPAQELLAESEKGYDLVAANATNRDTLQALVTGSVARALVAGASPSVLLARLSKTTGPLHAVFATDHSEYAERAEQALIALKPAGIGKLTVLTASPPRGSGFFDNMASEILEAAHGAVTQGAEAQNAKSAERLARGLGASTSVESVVREGEAREVLPAFMKESGADLLIVGAKGHGLAERLTLGSVSFDMAISPHPWSALILRV